MTDAEKKEPEMEFRTLGGTGLKVSTLSFGFWATFGVKENLDQAVKIMRIARDGGVNFFDNAEAYGEPNGRAEEIMGDAIQVLQKEDPEKWRRSDIVVSTKIYWGGKGKNEKGLSRKHIVEGLDASLKRLKLDYVDLVFCHRFDPYTPVLEIVQAYTDLIRAGKAHYWGTSEWSGVQICEAYWVAKQNGLIPPAMEQPQYNMMHRDRVELEYERLYKQPYRIGTTIWSPLASGILTGKYNDGLPDDSRMAHKNYKWLKDRWEREKAEKLPKLKAIKELADKQGCSMAQLAIAWCCKNSNVSTVILGATKEWQIKANLESLEVAKKMTKETYEKLEEILQNKPEIAGSYGRDEPKLVETFI